MGQESQDRRENMAQYIEQLEQIICDEEWMAVNQKLQRVYDRWIDKVFNNIRCQQYKLAETDFYEIYLNNKSNFLKTESAILDFMFRIHKKEIENGEESILRVFSSPEQMKNIYFELKFLMRRFEYDLPDELKGELSSFLQQYQVSPYAICEMVEVYISEKEKVLNAIAVFLFQKEYYEYVFPVLSFAYEKNPDNPETLYNMAYVLYAFQEREMALKIIGGISNPTECERQLASAIISGADLPDLHIGQRDEKREVPKLAKPEQPEKIAFIICVNNDRQFLECKYYIEHLLVPDGYAVEIIPIYHAKSMTSGYQEGMQRADAKYKIYIHQDVLCTNLYLLYDLLHIFSLDSDVGLVGVAGCVKMSDSGIWWKSDDNYYNLYEDSIDSYEDNNRVAMMNSYNCKAYQEVQAQIYKLMG